MQPNVLRLSCTAGADRQRYGTRATMPEGYHLRSRRSPRCQLQPLVSQHGDSLPRHACPLTPRPCRHGERERPCSCGAGADPGGAAASWAAVELRGSDRCMAAIPHPRDPALQAPARQPASRDPVRREARRSDGTAELRDVPRNETTGHRCKQCGPSGPALAAVRNPTSTKLQRAG